jgi:hypothetical protein
MAQQLKNVCNRLRKEGTEVYGFGIGTQNPAKYYGEDFFVYLDSIEAMGVKFFQRFASILTNGKVRL